MKGRIKQWVNSLPEPGYSSGAKSRTVDTPVVKTMAEQDRQVHRRNDYNEKKSTKLRIHDQRDKILAAIAAQRVVIIKGETGCGKTTQVPQFILESAGGRCNIVVTQPRRIAAISVATRVASERNRPLGTLVGYQIGLDKKGNEDTRILYVTTGVLLQKLIATKELNEFTHYIIDEIHERSQDMDFLLMVLRNFLTLKSKGEAKLILMSATIDEKKLRKYLAMPYNDQLIEPIIIDVTHSTQFMVRKYFLDDLYAGKNKIKEAMALKPFDPEEPQITEDAYRTAARIIQELDRLDSHDDDDDRILGERPAVLVFLPGLHEIETMEKVLIETSSSEHFWIKPLHSSITAEEQQAVFFSPPKSKRKIILSTNIAESSVTVTDIKYVIDFCLTKTLVTDSTTGCTSLELDWAPRSSLKQRAGRVGRIASGRVYRLISREFYQERLNENPIPEIQRCPLETLVLKAKLLEMGPPEEVLELAMDPPYLGNLVQAVAHLKQIGALHLGVNDGYDSRDGDLTSLGEVIAHLPLDVHLGKLIFLGTMFGVPEESIIMACAMATKNVFSTPYAKHLEAYDAKLWWADSTRSDCFAFLNAYKAWRERTMNRDVKAHELREFTAHHYLQLNVLKELANLEDEVKRRLERQRIYILEKRSGDRRGSTDIEKVFFLKLAIAGAFYPNYFVRGSYNTQDEEREALNTLGGHDPLSTVYLSGLPLNQKTDIYKNVLKKQFARISDRVEVNVDHGSKAYITFHSAVSQSNKGKIPGRIEMAVYRAVNMRLANVKVSIPNIKDGEATSIYNKFITQERCTTDNDHLELGSVLNKLVWPWRMDEMAKRDELLDVVISHIESPQKFWIQSHLRDLKVELLKLNAVLNERDMNVLVEMPSNASLTIGSLYVANSPKTNAFNRCRIAEKRLVRGSEYEYTIFFVDYGHSRKNVPANEIYDLDPEIKEHFFVDKIPHFAIECSLVKIQPKRREFDDDPLLNGWSDGATHVFKTFDWTSSSIAKVYAMVNDVLKVKLVIPRLKDEVYAWKNTINYELIAKGYAEKVNEDYISLCKHDEFKKFTRVENHGHYNGESTSKNHQIDFHDCELSEEHNLAEETILKGPYSPLEIKVFSMIRDSIGKPVVIGRDSVNSVLLDSDPSDPKEKMLVAAFVGMNQKRDRLLLRHTTMMPNIRGLPMLCCLLFAPMVELRVNPSFTRYTGALCGLGYHRKTRKSFYPAGDLSVIFDCEIAEEELLLINRLRYRINNVVERAIEMEGKELANIIEIMRDSLKELFLETRYVLQPTYECTEPFRWGLIERNRLRHPKSDNGPQYPADDLLPVYRLIWAVQRNENVDTEQKDILLSLKMLKKFSDGLSNRDTIECPLCKILLSDVPSAKLHLKTATHRARSERYHQEDDV